ncbi:DNA repair protein RecO [Pontiella agarivorans]|uniref:DNA repair protein RecO n=1 Tax=Pontiella agarivorans TaxID=3038953 RepID=A0ABU5N065_9BACT|nr:DNA repair protein RecO [Pontiella agarivorans]MDZ8119828.1 DNA repair protein RecO [Pontiella agarivorans]
MIIRATAIPLAIYPYSSTSHIVHWMTRHHGKISTLLKGALRAQSRFIGEYELFSTSELLYFAKSSSTLYTAKECALLERRSSFRTNWRAMQAASYLAALFNRTSPENAPHPELFALFEELLDLAENFGDRPQFIPWTELQFCDAHGHAPNLGSCIFCSSTQSLNFCASQGGTVCSSCSKDRKLPTLESPPEILRTLRNLQRTDSPDVAEKPIPPEQESGISIILNAFMQEQFNMNPQHRMAIPAA